MVHSKVDASWGSVVGINSNDFGKNHAQEIISRFTSIVDILGIFECSTFQRAELTRILGELEILSSQAQGNLDYSDAQKALLKEGVLGVKTLVNGLLSCCVASSPNGRVAAGTCELTSAIQAKTQTRISELQNFPKPSFSPYVIASSARQKGKERDGSITQDMISGDVSDNEIISLNKKTQAFLSMSIDELVTRWKNLSDFAIWEDVKMSIIGRNFIIIFVSSNTNNKIISVPYLTSIVQQKESIRRLVMNIKIV